MTPDLKSMFSIDQAVTATANGTYILDLKDNADDINRDLTLFVQVRTAAKAEGAATVTFSIETDDALNAGGTDLADAVTLWTSAAIAKAALTEGAFPVKMALPPGLQRYLRITYTVATGPLTAGTFDAGLIIGIDLP